VFTGGKRESISLHTAFEPEGAYVVWRRCCTPDRVDSVPSAGAAGEHPDVFAATSTVVMRKRFRAQKIWARVRLCRIFSMRLRVEYQLCLVWGTFQDFRMDLATRGAARGKLAAPCCVKCLDPTALESPK
jgi:hypothetical protein